MILDHQHDHEHDHPSLRTLLITLLERLRSRGLYGPSIAVGSGEPVSDEQLLRLVIDLLQRLLDGETQPEPKPDEKWTTRSLRTGIPTSMSTSIPPSPRPRFRGAGPRSPGR